MNAIRRLLEKYFLAETTLEEENVIAEYFRSGEVDPELMQYAAFFEYIEEEKQVSPGKDLEKRILERVGLAEAPVRRIKFGYAAAAAMLLCVCSLFLVVQLSGDKVKVSEVPQAAAVIKDTYDDPEKALAAVRRALLVASTHMNEGKNITQKNMSRLNNSWEAATGN
ncbi:MAG TPA: hypothetical protein VN824_17160 [Puia sp.]|nr:hypothetical protein [Puia sp.]